MRAKLGPTMSALMGTIKSVKRIKLRTNLDPWRM